MTQKEFMQNQRTRLINMRAILKDFKSQFESEEYAKMTAELAEHDSMFAAMLVEHDKLRMWTMKSQVDYLTMKLEAS